MPSFQQVDTDKNGCITLDEYGIALRLIKQIGGASSLQNTSSSSESSSDVRGTTASAKHAQFAEHSNVFNKSEQNDAPHNPRLVEDDIETTGDSGGYSEVDKASDSGTNMGAPSPLLPAPPPPPPPRSLPPPSPPPPAWSDNYVDSDSDSYVDSDTDTDSDTDIPPPPSPPPLPPAPPLDTNGTMAFVALSEYAQSHLGEGKKQQRDILHSKTSNGPDSIHQRANTLKKPSSTGEYSQWHKPPRASTLSCEGSTSQHSERPGLHRQALSMKQASTGKHSLK
ncbi:hypothetical protein CYMTET_55773 [Cymbomonas tetramitiformis]|uniref:EF-hand domain-containing protein n=1 Tax=Cymbomonas tetramitiformis TaxID=36881 RepID=A0AAE0BCB3_9CHLO|nr:hypothetical protein CYMTET_55773 [Cymbomonas tetramitiformis]